jgi:hypothetical protein
MQAGAPGKHLLTGIQEISFSSLIAISINNQHKNVMRMQVPRKKGKKFFHLQQNIWRAGLNMLPGLCLAVAGYTT